jgi:translation initiation factor IF-1
VEIDGKINFKIRMDRIDSVGVVYSTTQERVADIMLTAGGKF